MLYIKKLHPDVPTPKFATPDSAGMDICASIEEEQVLKPGKRALIPTGFCMELPKGYEAQIRPRSGLALKHGITVLNTPGTIDADYRAEVKVILINLGEEDFVITPWMRIAQMVVAKITPVKLEIVEELDNNTQRAFGGFGSTGV
ncbi:MAG: dUTP diphosphatase [Alphaproteobacteria bacterium]|nr:MAG: dUTP diphosphatase [Alphaproteobacteria bacterium]